MKKKLVILFVLIVGVLLYFYNRPKEAVDEKIYTDLQMPANQPVIFKTDRPEQETTRAQKVVRTQDKNFDEYDQNDRNWLRKIENILSASDYEFYLDIRNKNEEEKMKAYKEFHEYLRQKHGDNFSYNISEDQSIREKEINTKYTRELLKRIGEEKFKQYLQARDQFNEELQRQSKNGHALIVEF